MVLSLWHRRRWWEVVLMNQLAILETTGSHLDMNLHLERAAPLPRETSVVLCAEQAPMITVGV